MTEYRIQVHVVLDTGSQSVMAYGITAPDSQVAAREGRRRATLDPDVRRITMITLWPERDGEIPG